MSLLDFLRPQGAQMPGMAQQPSGLSRILQPEVALPMAAALLGNQGNMQNFGNAFGAAGQGLQAQTAKQQELAQQNKTYNFFKQNAPEFAQLIDGGMPVDQVWQEYTKQRYAQTPGSEVYGTPIYGVDSKTGKEGVGVFGKDGTFRVMDTGDFQVARGVTMNNTGTAFVPTSKSTGAVTGPELPIDNAGAARDTAAGKEQGNALATYHSMVSKMPGLEQTVGELDKLADEATYTMTGQAADWMIKQGGFKPRDAAVARTEYIAMVDNQVLPLLRDTFGAQFTVQEGASLRATLGDPDKSPEEKKAVLKAFIEQKKRTIQALALQTGQPAPAAPGGDMGGADPLGIR